MIVLNLKDGLGNQLFEYGFAKHLQNKTGDKIVINNYFFDGKKRRSYSLYHFKLDGETKVASKPRQLLLTASYMCRLFFCYPKTFIKWMTSSARPKSDEIFEYSAKKGMYVHFNTFHKFNIPASKRRVKYIYGNYENKAYIEDVLPILRNDFLIIDPPSDKNNKAAEELRNCESVCVHIRRGDYMDPKWSMLNVCNFDYYQNGMNEIEKKIPNAKFYVFSNTHNDIEWIKENYKFRQEVNYIDLGNPDYEELRLMMNCKHFVISNSTFSWWAAVLSNAENKIVVAPKNWIANESEGDWEGLYFDDWIRI